MPRLSKPIEIFYPGKQTAADGRKLSFPASQVAKWGKAGQRVPLVPGHPKDDRPVMGYATEFSFDKNRLKILAVEGLNPAFEAVVNSGQLNRVSVKLRPISDGWELAHIGFLGTSAPSLGDLTPAEFSNGEVIILAEDTDLEFAQRELELADREAEFAAKQADFAAVQKWQPRVAKLVAEGKVLPVEEAPLMACFARLDSGEAIEFARDGKDETANPAEFIANLLGATKARVTFGEVANAGKSTASKDGPAFAMKGGKAMVDDEDAEMHDAIVASGVDVKDHNAYAAAVKKYQKEAC
jgi:hypothetical protein